YVSTARADRAPLVHHGRGSTGVSCHFVARGNSFTLRNFCASHHSSPKSRFQISGRHARARRREFFHRAGRKGRARRTERCGQVHTPFASQRHFAQRRTRVCGGHGSDARQFAARPRRRGTCVSRPRRPIVFADRV